MSTEDYFLSPRNPIATTDQREAEAIALRLFEREDVREARRRAIFNWRESYGATVPAEA